MEIEQQIKDLYYSISASIEHGECFYDSDMLNDFITSLDKMKELAQQYYVENKQEDEDDGEV